MYIDLKHLMGTNESGEARLFLVVATDGTRGNRHKLEHMTSQQHRRKQCFTIRLVKIWLAKEVVESPSLVVFKTCWTWATCC